MIKRMVLRKIDCIKKLVFKYFMRPGRIADEQLSRAAEEFVPRMHAYPYMVKGTGTLCTLLNADLDIVAKGGANGLYGIGIKSLGIGISVKLADGTNGVWPMVIAEVFRQLGYENGAALEVLDRLCPAELVNDNGSPCGLKKPVFTLARG